MSRTEENCVSVMTVPAITVDRHVEKCKVAMVLLVVFDLPCGPCSMQGEERA